MSNRSGYLEAVSATCSWWSPNSQREMDGEQAFLLVVLVKVYTGYL
jgi:hypothetical protein